MVRRVCKNCGTGLTTQKLFCSIGCRRMFFKKNISKPADLSEAYVCPYNIGVECIEETYEACESCGWYPKVIQKRMEDIKNGNYECKSVFVLR